jgi:DNA-directed RNA polymerase subunit H (RpoH/RPB5)
MLSIEYTDLEIQNLIFENVKTMLNKRNLIDIKNPNIISSTPVTNIFTITLKNKTLYSLYFLPPKLQNISQNTPSHEYLLKNNDIHKIIIGKGVSKKVINQILHDYKNTEFFFEHEVIEDITKKIFIPTHYLLDKEEKEELLEKINKTELAKISNMDIMARYYNAAPQDIFKIIRYSGLGGYSLYYREVVAGSVNILFLK